MTSAAAAALVAVGEADRPPGFGGGSCDCRAESPCFLLVAGRTPRLIACNHMIIIERSLLHFAIGRSVTLARLVVPTPCFWTTAAADVAPDWGE